MQSTARGDLTRTRRCTNSNRPPCRGETWCAWDQKIGDVVRGLERRGGIDFVFTAGKAVSSSRSVGQKSAVLGLLADAKPDFGGISHAEPQALKSTVVAKSGDVRECSRLGSGSLEISEPRFILSTYAALQSQMPVRGML